MLEDNEHSITLTADNIEFPDHFYHTSIENGAIDVCNTENIRKYIHEAIDYFRINKNEYDYGCILTGNLYLHVQRYVDDKEYVVTISNNFYETEIPFETEDY